MTSPPSTPSTTGHHGGFFPELRLTKGVRNAADDELATSVESCERAALLGAVAVIAGLVAEVAFASIQTLTPIAWDTPDGTWGAVIADSLVALGVSAEVFFSRLGMSRQRELQRRSDAKLGEAIERAAVLEKETAQLKKQLRAREITNEQYDQVRVAMAGKPIPEFTVYIARDAEAFLYGMSLAFFISLLRDETTNKSEPVVHLEDVPGQTGVMFCGAGRDGDQELLSALVDAKIVGVGIADGRPPNMGQDKNGNPVVLPYCPPGSIFVGVKSPVSNLWGPRNR